MSVLKNIIVTGYMATGGTAVVDLLREFESIVYPGVEFRLIKERYGIQDLEIALTENWSFLSADLAIKDFLWLSKVHAKNHTRLSKIGYSYNKYICSEFLKITDLFINNITEYNYQFYWAYYDFDKFKFILNKIVKSLLRRLFRIKAVNKYRLAYFSKLDKIAFEKYVRENTRLIYECIRSKYQKDIVIFHNSFDPNQIYRMADYFDLSKGIVVDRDPRDVYAEIKYLRRNNFKDGLGDNSELNNFVRLYLSMREYKCGFNQANVLFIQFEELVYNYEEIYSEIISFLDLSYLKAHRKKYFDPEKSKKNIGIFKNLLTADEVSFIEKNLEKYLYHL